MIETFVRPAFQRFLGDPLVVFLKRQPFVTPVKITLLSAIFGVISGALLVSHYFYLAICVLLLSGLCDVLDGTLARSLGKASNKGAALDIICDRIVELAVIAAFFILDPARNGVGAFAMLGASYLCVTTFLVVGIFSHNTSQKSFQYSEGLIERAEAFIFFIAMMLFPPAFAWLAWVYFVLVMYTAAVRAVEFIR